MYILKYKDDSLKIRHYRELLRDLEYDCESNEIQMSDYDLIETHENIITTPTGDIYTESDFETIKKSKEYQDKLAKQERERLNMLSMTRGDVFEALILAKGLGKAQIRAMIEQAELDTVTKALYLNRFDEALEFYRGYPIFDMLGQALGITGEMLDEFFETNDYHALIKLEEVNNEDTTNTAN